MHQLYCGPLSVGGCLADAEPSSSLSSVLIPFLNEAILTLEQGTATAEDIDKTFVLGEWARSLGWCASPAPESSRS